MPRFPNLDLPSARSGGLLAALGVAGAAWALDARRRNRRLREMHRSMVDALLNALTADDPGTARHSRRVADLAYTMAYRYGLRDRGLATLRIAALFHDMGKIDDRFFDVVHSRKSLTAEQRAKIKHHPHKSAEILRPIEKLHPGIRKIVSSHHECWDGSGYPCGAEEEEIPLAARIIAIADVYDAMTQPRTYRGPLPEDEVLTELRDNAGTRFDPALVRLLDEPKLLDEWREISREGLACEAASPKPREYEVVPASASTAGDVAALARTTAG